MLSEGQASDQDAPPEVEAHRKAHKVYQRSKCEMLRLRSSRSRGTHSAQHDVLHQLLMINEEPDVEALHDFRSRLNEFGNERLNSPDFRVELVEEVCASLPCRPRKFPRAAFELPHLLLEMVREALAHDFRGRESLDCEVAERNAAPLRAARSGKCSGTRPKILRALFAHHFGNFFE